MTVKWVILNAMGVVYKVGDDVANLLVPYIALDQFFDEYIISADYGIRKPDDGIYEILLRRIGAAANDCTFVDDQLKNLMAARKLGFHTCRFDADGSSAPDSWTTTISGFSELPAVLSTFGNLRGPIT